MGAEQVRDPIARMSSMSIRDTDGPQAAINRKRRRQAETVLPRSLNRQLRLLAGSLGRRSAESWAHARGSLHPREVHQSAFVRPAREYFEKYPKERYQTEVESWRNLQSDNIEFTMKRLREPKT